MPTYHIELFEGRSVEEKRKLVEAVTRVKRENWATGGKLWSERS